MCLLRVLSGNWEQDGLATSYAVIFSNAVTVTYMNFTAVHANGTVDAELAAAIAALPPTGTETETAASTSNPSLLSSVQTPAPSPLQQQPAVEAGTQAPAPAAAAGVGIIGRSESQIPFPWSPPARIVSLDGTAFPPYRTVFVRGECTLNDFPKPEPSPFGPTTINTNKTCFSCFRIPTLLAGQTPGVIHAFAEGRRGELTAGFHQYTGSGMGSCPDGPDTRLAYKRSADYGASWSPIKILMQPADEAAENGRSQSQASPLIDPSTKTLFVGFNNGQGMAGPSVPGLINSTDDGITWSPVYTPILNLGGGKTQPADPKIGFAVGPTKGLTVKAPGGGVRLLLPGEGGKFGATSIFSDDHGQTYVQHARCYFVVPVMYCLN